MSEMAKNLDKQKKNDHAWRAIHGLAYWEKKWTCILNILISIIEGLIQEKLKMKIMHKIYMYSVYVICIWFSSEKKNHTLILSLNQNLNKEILEQVWLLKYI